MLNKDKQSNDQEKEMEISGPYNAKHVTHVGFDSTTGEFTFLLQSDRGATLGNSGGFFGASVFVDTDLLLYAAAFLRISKSREKYRRKIIKEAATGKLTKTEELVTDYEKKKNKLTPEQKQKLQELELERRKNMEERVETLAKKLVDRLRPFVEAKNPGAHDDPETKAFEERMRREADDLKLESFGVEVRARNEPH